MTMSTSPLDFTGDVVFITGAASGIGKQCAEQMSALGAKVVVTDWDVAAAEKVAASLNSMRADTALALRVDVTSWDEIDEAIQKTVQHFGRVDIAINSAGVVVGSELRLVKDTVMAEYDFINAVDARGVYMCMKAQLSVMSKQPLKAGRGARPGKRGAIVNISSRAGVEGVSKVRITWKMSTTAQTDDPSMRLFSLDHIVPQSTQSLPGLIQTPGHTSVAKEVDDFLLGRVPMGRFGSPQECVDGIIYLCSEMSSFCTGSTLEVDGGCAAMSR
ncbi:hypothetical protein CBS101457_005017 [Exobasidium rhododendri]|nr:hypothetical protein CBS101457_005017 [Exobasidium rhododendri]